MTCVELQESLAEVENGTTAEQKAHLRNCPACSALVKDLNLIITAAAGLQDADEPSPRVWNSIETALRREGLIRPQPTGASLAHSLLAGWGGRWLIPAVAVLLVATGLFWRQQMTMNHRTQEQATYAVPASSRAGLNDEDLIQEVAENAPSMKAQYEENLLRVNESIRDDQTMVEESPNDEDARRSLLDAYHQKSLLFELAMDRSLP
ncbi:MAG: anti-sigma factor [Candidatus Sulfotelmatobacter sp.]